VLCLRPLFLSGGSTVHMSHFAAHPFPSTPSHHGYATPRLVLPCTGDRKRSGTGRGACQPRCCRSPCALFQIEDREMDRTRRVRRIYDQRPGTTTTTRRPTTSVLATCTSGRLQQPIPEALTAPRHSMCFHYPYHSLLLLLYHYHHHYGKPSAG
jgi:hypothetical protein